MKNVHIIFFMKQMFGVSSSSLGGAFIFLLLTMTVFQTNAQQILALDDCRKLATEHSKDYKIKQEQVNIAKSTKKAAFTQYFPNINVTGAYMRFSDNISLLSEDKYAPIGTLMPDGSFGFRADQISNQWTMINGQPVPLDANGQPFNPKTDPEKIQWKDYAYLPKEEFTIDNQNIFVAGISLVQPIFLGGKIRELNKMAKHGENLALAQQEGEYSEILYNVDVAYWQVVSITNKLKMAEKYKELLEKLNSDVNEMMKEGVATQSDVLKVKVKYNEADLNVIKAQNGLNLSKMLLCQLIGLSSDSQISLADENIANCANCESYLGSPDMNQVYTNRPEIKQLNELSGITKAGERIALSRFLPNAGLTANYLFSNPNPFNGFEKEFKGSWNIGVAITVPIFHFGERFHTLNVAKAEQRIAQYKLDEAKEKIELQVRQSVYKVNEAAKRFAMIEKNYNSADENLRTAELAFKEGIASLSIVMEAQAAWQMAYSERIDSMIEMKLCNVYLQKAMGKSPLTPEGGNN